MNITAGDIGQLRATSLFAGFSRGDFDEIRRHCKAVEVQEGDILFAENEPCSGIYCVIDGLIKLFVTGPRDQEKIIEFIEPGETFAEGAMFSGQGYPVSAMAIMDSRLVSVDAYRFMRFLNRRPELAWMMLVVTSRRLHQLVAQVRSMCLHTAEQKVANYLMEYFDPDAPDQPVGHLPLRRAEFASALGLSVETLCRVVTNFRKRGWIRTHNSAIAVDRPQELKALLDAPAPTCGSVGEPDRERAAAYRLMVEPV